MTGMHLSLLRQPQFISALEVMPCLYSPNWELIPRDYVKVLTLGELVQRYPSRNFLFARGGDYIGLIRKKKSKQVVDFQISPHHENLRKPKWANRVIEIVRVMRVVLGEK